MPSANVPERPPSEGEPTTTSLHVRRAIDGDLEATGWLVERLSPWLLAQAGWRLGPALRRLYDPEDLVADAWAVALPRLPELPARDGRHAPVLLRFLATAITHRVNNLVKKHLRTAHAGDAPAPAESATAALARLPAPIAGIVTAAVRHEARDRVHAALEDLEAVDREIILLRAIEQCENRTVAPLLGITPEAAAMRYMRALRRLKERLPGTILEEIEA